MQFATLNHRSCAAVWWTVLCALALGAPRATAAFTWEYAMPEEQGVDSDPIARMLMQVQRDGIQVHSFILVRHDRIVSEVYMYPYTATTRHVQYSVSKSFTSALLGIAIADGLFAGVDERVVDIFRGATSTTPSANLSRMTLRHLLTMSTGHATDTTYRINTTSNWVKAFLDLPVENPPGAPFVYNSGASFMVSAAIQRRAGVNAATYGQSRLFGPLGITDWYWDVAPGGITTGGWGLWLRPLDMAKFGLLYLHDGVWEGQPVVPAWWVAESGRKQVETGPSGTFWESGYGYQFWRNDFGGYRADGAQGQFIFILPEHDAVAVFTAYLPDNWIPGDLVRTYVIPALETAPLPANPKANALLARFGVVLAAPATPATAAPLFTALPTDAAAPAGGGATFSVGVSGNPTPAVQWYRDGVALPGATGLTLTLSDLTTADDGDYVAVAQNSSGQLASVPAHLTVEAAPEIRRAPASLVVAENDEAVFAIDARGGELAYEWLHDGAPIANEHAPTLRIPAAAAGDAGVYEVVVGNARGRITSAPATLALAAVDDTPRLVNLSIRARAGEGEATLIVGLSVVGGDERGGLPVLLRGVGPTLVDYDVSAPLADPAIVLHAGATPLVGNGDWCGATRVAGVGARVGAFALPRASGDAALESALTPRTYTMHLTSSLPGTTGIALGECYDASEHATSGGPRLVNLSARASLTAGEGTLIAGFAIAGAAPLRVLVRGIGPALAAYDVAGVIADPELRLFAGDSVIATNDDWGGDAALRDAFVQTRAFALADDAKDAALLVTLPPGSYTAHVSSRDGATGVALIEVYAVAD